MIKLPLVSAGGHRPKLTSQLLFREARMGTRVVQIRLDTHRGGVIRSSEVRDEDEVGLLSPWSLRDRKGDVA